MPTTSNRESINIENSGGSVMVRAEGREYVEMIIKGDGQADYIIDGREDENASWEETLLSYTGQSNYYDAIRTGWAELQVRCSSGTGSANDSAEIVLCAGGK